MEELREALQAGWVNIIFLKLTTGERRNTTATGCLDLIPMDKRPKGCKVWEKEGYIRFFDLTVNNWRCLNVKTVLEWQVNDFLNGLIR